jgi:hypothetical protein
MSFEKKPDLVQEFIRSKHLQPQLEGFEDTNIQEMETIKNKMIEQVRDYQIAIHGLMIQIHRLQEGIEMEVYRGANGIWPE